MHGKQSVVSIDKDCKLFKGLPEVIKVARYHSLAADPEVLPSNLKVVATSDDGEVMAVKHKDYEIYGLQFHPESILTPDGRQMIKNFIA
jgi:anthranilate synthase component 2